MSFITRMQGWYVQPLKINQYSSSNYARSNEKKKKHRIILVPTEKASVKIQITFITKSP